MCLCQDLLKSKLSSTKTKTQIQHIVHSGFSRLQRVHKAKGLYTKLILLLLALSLSLFLIKSRVLACLVEAKNGPGNNLHVDLPPSTVCTKKDRFSKGKETLSSAKKSGSNFLVLGGKQKKREKLRSINCRILKQIFGHSYKTHNR